MRRPLNAPGPPHELTLETEQSTLRRKPAPKSSSSIAFPKFRDRLFLFQEKRPKPLQMIRAGQTKREAPLGRSLLRVVLYLLNMAGAAKCASSAIRIGAADSRKDAAFGRRAVLLMHVMAGGALHLAREQHRLVNCFAGEAVARPRGGDRRSGYC